MSLSESEQILDSETLDYVTPFALNLNSELHDKALARPIKRLLAIVIDALVIALMSSFSFLFALVLFIAAYLFRRMRLGSEIKRGAPLSFRGKRTIRVIVAFVCFLLILSIGVTFVLSKYNGIEGAPWFKLAGVTEFHEKEEILRPPENTSGNTQSIINLLKGAIADLGLSFGWAAVYFTLFTSGFHGRTIGKFLMGLQVVKLNNLPISYWEAFGRYGGYGAGMATGLLGFVQVYWDPNRQAIQDKISATIVLDLKKAAR